MATKKTTTAKKDSPRMAALKAIGDDSRTALLNRGSNKVMSMGADSGDAEELSSAQIKALEDAGHIRSAYSMKHHGRIYKLTDSGRAELGLEPAEDAGSAGVTDTDATGTGDGATNEAG